MKIKNPAEKRSRASEDIVAAVERDILGGILLPGQRVDEAALAETFGVSRTPVREAILELAAVGLVEQRAHRGAFIADVTLEEIFDVYEVLAELEGLCARLAARRMETVERRELLDLHEKMGQLLAVEDRDAYIALDYQFHGILIKAARNAALKDHLSMCLKRIAPIRRTSMEMVRDMRLAHAEHGEIIAAIHGGDAAAAERIMSEHVSLRAEQAKDLIARWKTRPAATVPAGG
jgi:DNA-binding GntR family transcriptional regulator